MRNWIYVSECAISGEERTKEIGKVVETSTSRNASLDVTGALLFCGDRFAQLLEGPDLAIRDLQGSILKDRRHQHITTIVDAPILNRQFGDWALAYSGSSTFFGNLLASAALRQEDQAPDVTANLSKLFAAFAGSLAR